jgi:hypothetical protein
MLLKYSWYDDGCFQTRPKINACLAKQDPDSPQSDAENRSEAL